VVLFKNCFKIGRKIRKYVYKTGGSKMNARKILAALTICFVMGAALMCAGKALGYSDEKKIDACYLEIEKDGILAFESEIPSFTNIKTKVITADIDIISSDSYKLNIQSEDGKKILWKVSDNTLTIKQSCLNKRKCRRKGGQIKIYVPADFKCSGVDIGTVSGSLKAEGLSCPRIKIESVSGDIKLQDLKSAKFNGESVSGDINISGFLSGKSKIETVSGDISINNAVKSSDYSKDIETVSGKIIIDGIRTKKSYKENNAAANEIDVETVSGDITLNFAK
jgi:DUF4097 and DUF4098 domain-containing protein YvlB